MIIDDLDPFRRAFPPDEADPPLIVDPDTILPLPCRPQRPQAGFLELPPYPPASPRRPASAAFAVLPLQCCRICGCAGGERAFRSPCSGRIVSPGQYITDAVKRSPINGIARHLPADPHHLAAAAASASLQPGDRGLD